MDKGTVIKVIVWVGFTLTVKAIEALHTATDPAMQREADKWLQDFRTSTEAWSLIIPLLETYKDDSVVRKLWDLRMTLNRLCPFNFMPPTRFNTKSKSSGTPFKTKPRWCQLYPPFFLPTLPRMVQWGTSFVWLVQQQVHWFTPYRVTVKLAVCFGHCPLCPMTCRLTVLSSDFVVDLVVWLLSSDSIAWQCRLTLSFSSIIIRHCTLSDIF